ncbi:MAG: hypothetical protein KF819_33260 [Labilithrix sp.]|nr:hypothetical protein [Labilithrix sp.]
MALVACGDAAEWRPAKGAADFPAEKTSYRVKEADPTCTSLGYVIKASSIDQVAETAANHGATHYKLLEDFKHVTLETETSAYGGRNWAVANSTTSAVTHHKFVAEAYRCK